MVNIIKVKNLSKNEYQILCKNSMKAANDYDFKVLSKKLIDYIESVKG